MGWIRKRRPGPDGSSAEGGDNLTPDLAATAPGLLEQMYVNADLLEQKALLQHQNHDTGPALATQAQAVEAWERVVAGDPCNPMAGKLLGAAYNQHAVYLALAGRMLDAVDETDKALVVLAPLTHDDPQTILPIIHKTLGNLIVFLQDTGQHDDADLARQDRARVEDAIASLD